MTIKTVSEFETQCIKNSWRLCDGVIVWNRPANGGKKIGDIVGVSIRKSGHKNVYLSVSGKLQGFVYARVVWLLHYGTWPEFEVDHIDCNPQNDAVENLRQATRFENCQNTRFGRTQKAFKGTFQDKRNGKWHCQIQAFGQVHGLYGFDSQQDAYAARQELAKQLHGEFAR
jgi:hypothetical protein